MKVPSIWKVIYHVNLFLVILLFWLIMAGAIFGENTDAPSKMPMQAQLLINHEADQEKALQDKLTADIVKLHQTLITRLKPQEDTAIHHEDLDGAQAIKAEIVALQPKTETVTELTTDDVLGTYQISTPSWSGTWTLVKGGAATSAGASGNWKLVDSTVTISWSNGLIETIALNVKDLTSSTCTIASGVQGTAKLLH